MAAQELFSTKLFNDANLISYWRMEGNSNDAKDSNNGSDTSITYNSGNGKFGQGAGLASGSSSRIDIGNPANLKITGNFSVGAWAKTSTINANQWIFAMEDFATNIAGYSFGIQSDNNARCEIGKNTGTTLNTDYWQVVSSGINVTDGNWHFFCITWNGTNFVFYIDAVSAGSVAAANAAYTATIKGRIGDQGSNESAFFNGAIDEVFVFNRALSSGEITSYYNGPTGGLFGFFEV